MEGKGEEGGEGREGSGGEKIGPPLYEILNTPLALRCVRWYLLAYATEIKSIQLHGSIEGLSQR